jgi:hypothetical protein
MTSTIPVEKGFEEVEKRSKKQRSNPGPGGITSTKYNKTRSKKGNVTRCSMFMTD